VDIPKKNAEGNAIRDEAGEEVREVLLDIDNIHKAILEWNKEHFHQADKTPFAGGAENTVVYDLIGYTGMSQAAKDVVDGTFPAAYGVKLGNILPEKEQVICKLSMSEEIKVLAIRLTLKSQKRIHFRVQRLERKHVHFPIGSTPGALQGHCE
jgi:hypothetical protein